MIHLVNYPICPIMRFVFLSNGLNHQRNGAYREELEQFPPPYRNFTSGTSIDKVSTDLERMYGVSLSENDLLEKVYKHYYRKR